MDTPRQHIANDVDSALRQLGIPSTAYAEFRRRDLKGAAICGSICAYGVRPHSVPAGSQPCRQLRVPRVWHPTCDLLDIFCQIHEVSAERFHEMGTGQQWRIHYRLSSGQM